MTHSHPDFDPRRLSQRELPALAQLAKSIGLDNYFQGDATLHGSDPIIRSPHRLGEASGIAQLLIGMAGAAIWKVRTGGGTDLSIDIVDALHFLHPTHYVAQQGRPINVGAEHVAVNDLFLCRDGRYVMLEAGPPYPKLLDGYLNFFDCGNNKESIAREVAKWDSEALETAMAEAGLPACRALTREEWLAHPQGRALQATPVIEIERVADGPAIPFNTPTQVNSPLQGIRVLDFTHVLAGPRSARTLAEYGADVLHVSSPSYPDTLAQHLGVDVGKRCAYLDLRDPADLAKMLDLSTHADVFTTSYRHGVNARFGLLPQQLFERSARGIVCLTVNAYGHSGPWAQRPGFDQNGQVATGFAVREGLPGKPRFSPVFYLADLITGYLAAAGMMAALLRRSIEGGSYHAKVSLARSAMWVQELGLLDLGAQDDLPAADTYPARLSAIKTPYGTVSGLHPPLKFSALQLPQADLMEPYGASPAEWLNQSN